MHVLAADGVTAHKISRFEKHQKVKRKYLVVV
jgi:hypothetical protein